MRLPKFGEVWAWRGQPRFIITEPEEDVDARFYTFKVISLVGENGRHPWQNVMLKESSDPGDWKLLSDGEDT